MAEIATAAARLQGKKVSQMLQDIVVASGRQSVLILDNLGISSSIAGEKQREFAASLGKTRAQLTEMEKSQAFFFAVMEAGGEIMKQVNMETLTLGEKLQILEARAMSTKASIARELKSKSR